MKLEVTEKGVYDAKGKMVPVGTTVTVKGDVVPDSFVNKSRVTSESPKGKVAVTNPATGAANDKATGDVSGTNTGAGDEK